MDKKTELAIQQIAKEIHELNKIERRKMDLMMIKRTLYLCDGKQDCNKSLSCVYNGGEDCMHTTKTKHALNQPIVLPDKDPSRYNLFCDANKHFMLFVEKSEEEDSQEKQSH